MSRLIIIMQIFKLTNQNSSIILTNQNQVRIWHGFGNYEYVCVCVITSIFAWLRLQLRTALLQANCNTEPGLNRKNILRHGGESVRAGFRSGKNKSSYYRWHHLVYSTHACPRMLFDYCTLDVHEWIERNVFSFNIMLVKEEFMPKWIRVLTHRHLKAKYPSEMQATSFCTVKGNLNLNFKSLIPSTLLPFTARHYRGSDRHCDPPTCTDSLTVTSPGPLFCCPYLRLDKFLCRSICILVTIQSNAEKCCARMSRAVTWR